LTTGTLLVLILPLDECIDNTQREMKFRERKKGRRKKNKEAQLMTKTKERKKRSQARQSTNSTLKTARKLLLNKCKLPLNMWMQTSKF
jgi:hypothetical protein